MGEENVLKGGLDVLNEIRENLVELESYKQKANDLIGEEDRLEKLISSKSKAMETEITTTVKKRQEEVENSFDGQIDKTRGRVKKVKAKKDKLKNAKVSERIEMETADLREEKRKLTQDIKAVFKVNKIPSLFNCRYFFMMYMPGSVLDFVVILLSVIVMLAIPFGIYCLLPEAVHKIWMLVVLYLAFVSLCMTIFIMIFKKVKTRHSNELHEAQKIRAGIVKKKKQIVAAARAIKHDEDESKYGLEKYDNEINELEQQVADIINEKKEALTTFENKTKPDIISEIKAQKEEEINSLKKEYDETYEEQRKSEDKINSFILEISRKYEAYVGKEVLSIPMIDSLIEIIKTGDALTISDALVKYKQQYSEIHSD